MSLLQFPHSNALALLFAGLTSFGCYARGHGYVVAESPPAYVETYPTYYYEGRTVYLVDGHWYTRDRGRWMYYRSEPRELHRYRTEVRVAPPARHRSEVRVAPPAPRVGPPPVRAGRAPQWERHPPSATHGDRPRQAPPARRFD